MQCLFTIVDWKTWTQVYWRVSGRAIGRRQARCAARLSSDPSLFTAVINMSFLELQYHLFDPPLFQTERYCSAPSGSCFLHPWTKTCRLLESLLWVHAHSCWYACLSGAFAAVQRPDRNATNVCLSTESQSSRWVQCLDRQSGQHSPPGYQTAMWPHMGRLWGQYHP
jgi:hypothetical protein